MLNVAERAYPGESTGVTGGEWFRTPTSEYRSPVAVVNGDLVAFSSDTVAGYHPRTGERRWVAEMPGSHELPRTAFVGGPYLYIGSNPLTAVDLTDGSVVWQYEARTGENELELFRPATDGRRVYISAYWEGETIALDAESGDVVWRRPERLGDPIVAGRTVYCANGGGITALDAETGDRRGQIGSGLVPSDQMTTLAATRDRLYLAHVTAEGSGNQMSLHSLEAA